MSTLSSTPRLLRVLVIALRWRLHEFAQGTRLYRPLALLAALLPRAHDARGLPRGERLRLALTELGPIFVKFGQVLSTRRDLLPVDLADALAKLRDQVEPFPGAQARATIEQQLGKPVAQLYAEFDETPLASASIAQVHAARLPDGRAVVVKVLRPGIAERIARDTRLLRSLGNLAQRWHPRADKIRPLDVVDEIEKTLEHELDLQREGANASLLRRNFAHAPHDLYVPEVHWDWSAERVLTLERVHGIPADDIAALDALGVDRKALARKGVRLFYEQVFRDNFFHADAHPGNIWVDPREPADASFIALDFGIMGSLPETDQYLLAENFMALFQRDYRRIAELHVAAGWMPASVRLDELEAATRAVCEPYFTRPMSEISIAEVTMKLFQTAREYELTLQPQLILLQKTLLNIEGLGRQLDPGIDIWAVAEPILRQILRRRYGPRAWLREIKRRAPEWMRQAPRLPELLIQTLEQAASGRGELVIRARELEALAANTRVTQRLLAGGLFGSTLLILAALLWTLQPRLGVVAPAVLAALGALAWWRAWPRRGARRG
ncbi:ubiquinone biosynthesis regulatory protein kinase UbiB [Metallibacterium sp.]|jgi:ubiquinone biosynthesis protein|uniref:ubiquinone biosynthesis regulatory protein kinase UbiB n=1 Tax=Metallibacterium sp. TaxID=2940281 RepID=UPI00260C5105|nr:ubiquinone biosynthesis regulatory protein kinase UbiB [Metallibacterium sp.]